MLNGSNQDQASKTTEEESKSTMDRKIIRATGGFQRLVVAREFKKALEVLQLDTDKIIDVNAATSAGMAPPLFLCIGITEMHPELAQALILRGADVNAKNEDGISIAGNVIQTLHYCCNHGDCEPDDVLWKGAIAIADLLKANGLIVTERDKAFFKETINYFKEDDIPNLKQRLTAIFL